METDSRAAGLGADTARRPGQRHRFVQPAAKQFHPMNERRAVMASYGSRSRGQRSGDPHGMLARSVTSLRGDQLGRSEHTTGQPEPSSVPDKAAKLPPRHARSRKLSGSHHSR